MAKTHELKIFPRWFDDVKSGKKRFELRKADRDYEVGDSLFDDEENRISIKTDIFSKHIYWFRD